jgi:hypothetical protein
MFFVFGRIWVLTIAIVVHPLNGTQGKNKINCVHEGVQDGPDEKEL